MAFVGNTFIENFKMAFATLRSNLLRSFLTIIGVVIGVITVMIISSIISGVDLAVSKQIESFGTNSIFLYKTKIGINTGRPSREERMRKPLTLEDAVAIENLPSVEAAIPFLNVTSNRWGAKIMVTGKNGKSSSSVNLEGTFPNIDKSTGEVLIMGRWFTQTENDSRNDVAVIGSSVVDAYFEGADPIGNTLEIGGREFRVIGVLQKRDQLFGGGGGNNDQSNVIYMPMGSAQRIKPNSEDLFINAIAKNGMLEQAKDQIQDLLRVRRQVPLRAENNFSMETADSIIEQFRSIMQYLALAMVVISSVGLMIGGIGVMNIMLVSVTERTREIGIRKAIGAKQSDILLQFLVEAATLTGIGGLIGLAIGWLITTLISLVFPSYVPPWAPIAGFVASVGIGIIFGLFPAWKAARLDPIESLRYE